MGTILCATDLTPAARPVVAVAAALSRALGDRLELFHVLQVPPELPPDLFNESVFDAYRDSPKPPAEAQVARFAPPDWTRAPASGRGSSTTPSPSAPATSAPSCSCVGTHARKGAPRFFVGSVAERAIRAAPCPTLVVPPTAAGRLASGERPAGAAPDHRGDRSFPRERRRARLAARPRRRTPCDLRLVHVYWPMREHERLGFGPPLAFEIEPGVTEVLTRELRAHIVAELGRDDVPLRVRPSWGAEEDPPVLGGGDRRRRPPGGRHQPGTRLDGGGHGARRPPPRRLRAETRGGRSGRACSPRCGR